MQADDRFTPGSCGISHGLTSLNLVLAPKELAFLFVALHPTACFVLLAPLLDMIVRRETDSLASEPSTILARLVCDPRPVMILKSEVSELLLCFSTLR